MALSVVSTAERPDLAPVTGLWRWEAFFRDTETSLAEVLERDARCAAGAGLMPTVLVLLEQERPVGMIALRLDDLEGRPELNPWLAGLYVDPAHRGRGFARRLIEELEALARRAGIESLSLYTPNAAGLYAKAGWTAIERFERGGESFAVMRKTL